MKRIFIYGLLLTLCLPVAAQIKENEELGRRLAGKTSFYEVQDIVTAYYSEKKQQLRGTDSVKRKSLNREQKFWNRWFYENESRMGYDGKIINYSARNFAAIEQEKLSTYHNAHGRSSAFGEWEQMGPTANSSGIGRVNRLAFDPVNANTVYAGTATGGLWRTTNNGSSWAAISSFIPSLGISGIVVNHNNPQEIYILTGDGDANNSGGLTFQWGYAKLSIGVMKSVDGGVNWFRTGMFIRPNTDTLQDEDQYYGLNLVQSHQNSNVLIAATSHGLFKTENGGQNWLRVKAGTVFNDSLNSNNVFFDVAFKPGSETEVYAAGKNGFFKSTDGGNIFLKVSIPEFNTGPNDNPHKAGRIKIGTTPANPNLVYLFAGPGFVLDDDNSDDRYMGFFRSTNSGVSFQRRHNTPDLLAYNDALHTLDHQSDYDIAVAVNHSNADLAITGGLVAWRTEDGGTDFDEIADYFDNDPDNSNYIHPDIHDLAFNPLNGHLWAATDGGVSHSTDNGTTWVQHFNFPITQFYHFEPANDDDLIWGGSQDNGVQEQDGPGVTTFNKFSGGDGYDVLTDVENRDDVYYVINEYIYTDGETGNISPDEMEDRKDNFFPMLAMHPNNENILYAGYRILFQTLDETSTWRTFKDPFGDTLAGNWCLTTSQSNGDRVYMAGRNYQGGQKLWSISAATTASPVIAAISNNMGALWTGIQPPKITDIATSPSNSNSITVTLGGFIDQRKVLHSDDAGLTWQNWSYDLPNVPINTVITDAAGNMYVGTDIGVYYSNNSLLHWQPFFNNMPRVPVSELAFHTVGGKAYVYASTYGRGIWRSEIFQNCQQDITVSQALGGPMFFQASNQIASTSIITGGEGTVVNFQSGNEIVLTPGFWAQPGNQFRTAIAPCNSGIPASLRLTADPGDAKRNNKLYPLHYLYGKVTGASRQNDIINITLALKKDGNYRVKIIESQVAGQKVLYEKVLSAKGNEQLSIAQNQLQGKPFMVQLYYGDELVHQQEIDP
jgi:hypothetical protein